MNTVNPFSPHKDVLEAAIPESAESKAKLLEELKNRGRSAVQAGMWPDAALLYRKALEVCGGDNNNDNDKAAQLAILNANLSLTEGKMNGWDAAHTAAVDATVADPTYVKGWWRLGQAKAALKQYEDAVKALEKGMALEPTNKALQKELTKMKEKAEQAKQAKATDQQTDNKTKVTTTTTTIKKTTTSTTTTSKSSSSNNSSDPVDMEVEGTKFTKSDQLRGYKIVNGKKTSYFHNELSEDAKKLIGDIAPKKLEATEQQQQTAAAAAAATTDPTTSAWNKAGTWEERDVTVWAKEQLESMLLHSTYTLPSSSPAPGAAVQVTKAKATGHASVAAVRGKKRYIYEFALMIEWKFEHPSNFVTAEGSMNFPDVDGTCTLGDGYDVTDFIIKKTDDNHIRPVLESFVHNQGLRDVLHESIDNWVRLFRETY